MNTSMMKEAEISALAAQIWTEAESDHTEDEVEKLAIEIWLENVTELWIETIRYQFGMSKLSWPEDSFEPVFTPVG